MNRQPASHSLTHWSSEWDVFMQANKLSRRPTQRHTCWGWKSSRRDSPPWRCDLSYSEASSAAPHPTTEKKCIRLLHHCSSCYKHKIIQVSKAKGCFHKMWSRTFFPKLNFMTTHLKLSKLDFCFSQTLRWTHHILQHYLFLFYHISYFSENGQSEFRY